jgi:hypothetical protein
MHESMEDPEHAMSKLTRPYQWLRREAMSNLGIMQAHGRPRMVRQVKTPGLRVFKMKTTAHRKKKTQGDLAYSLAGVVSLAVGPIPRAPHRGLG